MCTRRVNADAERERERADGYRGRHCQTYQQQSEASAHKLEKSVVFWCGGVVFCSVVLYT